MTPSPIYLLMCHPSAHVADKLVEGVDGAWEFDPNEKDDEGKPLLVALVQAFGASISSDEREEQAWMRRGADVGAVWAWLAGAARRTPEADWPDPGLGMDAAIGHPRIC